MNGVLIREGKGRGAFKNVGDFTQSIAQRQYWKKIDTNVEMEELDEVESNEPVNVIMNGWFMWHPEKFPPSPCVNPLFVSFHIAPSIEHQFFTEETVAYLKKHEPIGTRDTTTQKLMEKYGIKSYFSGCLTLTLDKTYLQKEHGEDIYIVDPLVNYFYPGSKIGKVKSLLGHFWYCLTHYSKMSKLSKMYYHHEGLSYLQFSKKLQDLIETTAFYRKYSQCFSDDIILNAHYISQIVDNYTSVDEKFRMADERLKKYAKAKLVITRRIHAALPCLSIRTPVILTINDDIIDDKPQIASDGGRFGGNLELFNYKKFSKNGVESVGCDNYITLKNIPTNPEKYLYYRNLLNDAVEAFVKTCEKSEN